MRAVKKLLSFCYSQFMRWTVSIARWRVCVHLFRDALNRRVYTPNSFFIYHVMIFVIDGIVFEWHVRINPGASGASKAVNTTIGSRQYKGLILPYRTSIIDDAEDGYN